MKWQDALDAVRREVGATTTTELIDRQRLKGGVLVLVTEHISEIPTTVNRTMTTRRLTVFEDGKAHPSVGMILTGTKHGYS